MSHSTAQQARVADLTRRVALITGGARDIGRSIAAGLARCGADVLVTYMHSAEEAKTAVAEMPAFGHRAQAVPFDAHDADAVTALADAALEFGRGKSRHPGQQCWWEHQARATGRG